MTKYKNNEYVPAIGDNEINKMVLDEWERKLDFVEDDIEISVQPMTIIQMRNERTLFFDVKFNQYFYIVQLFSEHKINHVKVIYMKSICGKFKQQFTDGFFDYLLSSKQLIERQDVNTK